MFICNGHEGQRLMILGRGGGNNMYEAKSGPVALGLT